MSGSEDKTVRLWDVASASTLGRFVGHSGSVTSVVFCPGGREAASASKDHSIRLWDLSIADSFWSRLMWRLEGGGEIRTLTGHAGEVNALASLPDGRILSGSNDGTMRLWNKATGEVVATMMSSSDGSWLMITPEGFFSASSPEKAQNFFLIVREFDVCPVELASATLHRPDLVREKLAGDPHDYVRAAAAKLDLNTVCFSH